MRWNLLVSRKYQKSRRIELEEETRLRIVRALVALHGSIGPARTTVRAVAEAAGVQRSTVYRHFPDEPSMYAACSAHWTAEHPFPDPGAWLRIEDPTERTRTAIDELYAFYARGAGMLENIFRDESLVEALAPPITAFREYLGVARDAILAGCASTGRDLAVARGVVGHAVAFSTWRSLTAENGLDHEDAVSVMVETIERAAVGIARGNARARRSRERSTRE